MRAKPVLIKLEAGTQYRTRGGRVARVYAVDGLGPYPVHGAVWRDGDHEWSTGSWTSGGRAYEEESADDIVSAWREPIVLEGWVNVYEAPGGYGFSAPYDTEDQANERAGDTRLTVIRVRGVEGT